MSRQHVLIIGGGFSGLVTATHLIHATTADITITIVEDREETGRGIAYSTPVTEHLVNGPAKLFSVFPRDPTNLTEWLRSNAQVNAQVHGWSLPEGVDYPDSYPSRWVYGNYVQHQFQTALDAAGGRVQFTHLRGRAVDLTARGEGYSVVLNDGNRVFADRVVLATGLFTSSHAHGYADAESLQGTNAFVSDIWDEHQWDGIAGVQSVLIIGSGLTAVDAMLYADSRGYTGRFTTLSRHGLTAQARRDVAPLADVFADGVPATANGLLRLISPIRRRLKREGDDWQKLSGAIRGQLLNLWDGAAALEKQRFISRLRRFWEISVHRVAPESGRKLASLLADGRVHNVKGHIRSIASNPSGGVDAAWRVSGTDELKTESFDRVLAAHGYEFNWQQIDDELIRNLLARGWVRPHPTGFGIQAQRASGAVWVNERFSDTLFAVGHPMRGVTWESSAIGEIALGADVAAHALASRINAGRLDRSAEHGANTLNTVSEPT